MAPRPPLRVIDYILTRSVRFGIGVMVVAFLAFVQAAQIAVAIFDYAHDLHLAVQRERGLLNERDFMWTVSDAPEGAVMQWTGTRWTWACSSVAAAPSSQEPK